MGSEEMSQCWAQNNTGRERLRAIVSCQPPGPSSHRKDLQSQPAGWAIGLLPCNFMLDLSCHRPQSLSISIPTYSFNRVVVKSFFRFFLASFFTSRAGSRGLSISYTISICKTHSFDNLSIPAVRFLHDRFSHYETHPKTPNPSP
jgi:hypothetical protein